MAFTDTFTGTDGTELPTYNVKWVTPSGGTAMEVLGGTATGTVSGGVFNSNYYNDTFADKHYAIGTLAVGLDGGFHGITIRAQANGDFFYAIVEVGTCFAGEYVGGTGVDWDGGQSGWAGGDTVELHVDATTSTTVHLKRNGTIIQTYTGKNALTGGKAGVVSINVVDGTGINAWEGGDVGGAAAPALSGPLLVSRPRVLLRM